MPSRLLALTKPTLSSAPPAPALRHVGRLALLALLASVHLAQAQTSPASPPTSRAQVKMERDEFLRTHRWHEQTQTWLLRDDVQPPPGVKTRAEVKAERDAFLRANRWDERSSGWVPVTGAPRDPNGVSRAEVKRDTAQFLRTHIWDEASDTYVLRSAPRAKR